MKVLRCPGTGPYPGGEDAQHRNAVVLIATRESLARFQSGRNFMMQRGFVKRLVLDRGFGFLANDAGQEYFFHRTGMVHGTFENLREGIQVTFEEEASPKGLRASSVCVV